MLYNIVCICGVCLSLSLFFCYWRHKTCLPACVLLFLCLSPSPVLSHSIFIPASQVVLQVVATPKSSQCRRLVTYCVNVPIFCWFTYFSFIALVFFSSFAGHSCLQFNLHLTGDLHAITAANNLCGRLQA